MMTHWSFAKHGYTKCCTVFPCFQHIHFKVIFTYQFGFVVTIVLLFCCSIINTMTIDQHMHSSDINIQKITHWDNAGLLYKMLCCCSVTTDQTWDGAKKGLNVPPQALASICTVVLLCITVYHIKSITEQARVRVQARMIFFFHLFFQLLHFYYAQT